jgi:hypothetical protein
MTRCKHLFVLNLHRHCTNRKTYKLLNIEAIFAATHEKFFSWNSFSCLCEVKQQGVKTDFFTSYLLH